MASSTVVADAYRRHVVAIVAAALERNPVIGAIVLPSATAAERDRRARVARGGGLRAAAAALTSAEIDRHALHRGLAGLRLRVPPGMDKDRAREPRRAVSVADAGRLHPRVQEAYVARTGTTRDDGSTRAIYADGTGKRNVPTPMNAPTSLDVAEALVDVNDWCSVDVTDSRASLEAEIGAVLRLTWRAGHARVAWDHPARLPPTATLVQGVVDLAGTGRAVPSVMICTRARARGLRSTDDYVSLRATFHVRVTLDADRAALFRSFYGYAIDYDDSRGAGATVLGGASTDGGGLGAELRDRVRSLGTSLGGAEAAERLVRSLEQRASLIEVAADVRSTVSFGTAALSDSDSDSDSDSWTSDDVRSLPRPPRRRRSTPSRKVKVTPRRRTPKKKKSTRVRGKKSTPVRSKKKKKKKATPRRRTSKKKVAPRRRSPPLRHGRLVTVTPRRSFRGRSPLA